MDEILLIGMLFGRAARDLYIICSVGGLLLVKTLLVLQGVFLKNVACGWLLFAPLLLGRPPNRLAD